MKALVGARRRAARRRGHAPPDVRRRRPRRPRATRAPSATARSSPARTCAQAVNEGRADYVPVFLSEIPGLVALAGASRSTSAFIHISPPDEHGFCSYGVGVECTKAAAETRADGHRPGQPPDAALARRLVHPRLAPHARGRDRPAARRAARSATEVGEVARAIGQQRRRPHRERLHAADGHRRDPRRRAPLPEGEARPRHPHRDVLGRRGRALRGGRRHRRGEDAPPGQDRRLVRARLEEDVRLPRQQPLRGVPPERLRQRPVRDRAERQDGRDQLGDRGRPHRPGLRRLDGPRRSTRASAGQVDFVRGASRSRGGKPIIALPSTAKDGTISRIVRRARRRARAS